MARSRQSLLPEAARGRRRFSPSPTTGISRTDGATLNRCTTLRLDGTGLPDINIEPFGCWRIFLLCTPTVSLVYGCPRPPVRLPRSISIHGSPRVSDPRVSGQHHRRIIGRHGNLDKIDLRYRIARADRHTNSCSVTAQWWQVAGVQRVLRPKSHKMSQSGETRFDFGG
jgi:hypothetical protein